MMSSMKKIDHPSSVDGPVVSEGGRGLCTLSTGQALAAPAAAPTAAPMSKVGPLAPGQRWSVARKREVVLRRLARRERGTALPRARRSHLQARAMAPEGGRRPRQRAQGREADATSVELDAAMKRIGELSMEVELLRARIEKPGPLARRRSR
jgi:hypothetical protein